MNGAVIYNKGRGQNFILPSAFIAYSMENNYNLYKVDHL
jgi:hypothetical protein